MFLLSVTVIFLSCVCVWGTHKEKKYDGQLWFKKKKELASIILQSTSISILVVLPMILQSVILEVLNMGAQTFKLQGCICLQKNLKEHFGGQRCNRLIIDLRYKRYKFTATFITAKKDQVLIVNDKLNYVVEFIYSLRL